MCAAEVSQPSESSPVQGKSFWIRAAAYIIDSFLYAIANFALTMAIAIVVGIMFAIAGAQVPANPKSNDCLSWVLGAVLFILYGTVFDGLYGASPGKLILSMRVVKEDGAACDLRAAFIRALYRYVDGFFLGIPAYVTMKPPLHQRLGDKSAKTIVVSSHDPFIRQPREWWWFLVALALAGLADGLVATILLVMAVT